MNDTFKNCYVCHHLIFQDPMGKQGLRVFQDPKKKYEYWVSKFNSQDITLRVLVDI